MKQPTFSKAQLLACLPLSLFHAFTNTLMLTSLAKIAVSLSHTIRATEPLFVTAAAALVLGTRPSAPLVWSLLPIVVGVAVASATDVSFSWIGFMAAMGSNLASCCRNVYSKQVMSAVRGNIDSVSLLTLVNLGAFVLLLPLGLVMEAPALAEALRSAADPGVLLGLALLSALLLQSYQQMSYNILSKVSAVTHSVANCVKRVVVIVAAVVLFAHPVRFATGLGTGLALLGVCAYSAVKLRAADRKKRDAAASAAAAAASISAAGGADGGGEIAHQEEATAVIGGSGR